MLKLDHLESSRLFHWNLLTLLFGPGLAFWLVVYDPEEKTDFITTKASDESISPESKVPVFVL